MTKKHTPWGAADRVTTIAPGITSYSTAGHGGINLSVERIAQMPDELRALKPWAGPGWYEEDCDWQRVALSFPLDFDLASVASAVRGIASSPLTVPSASGEVDHYLAPARVWLASEHGAPVRAMAEAWHAANASMYRVACEGSIPRRHEALAARLMPCLDPYTRHNLGWAMLRRVSDGAGAEALLMPAERRGAMIDLSAIPAERVIRAD